MCVCAGGERREEGGERNRCTRQRDADRRGSFSFFSPLPLPSPFVRLPRYVCTVLSLSLSLSASLVCFFLYMYSFLSVQEPRAGSYAASLCTSRYHRSICAALSRTATLVPPVARAVDRECSIIRRFAARLWSSRSRVEPGFFVFFGSMVSLHQLDEVEWNWLIVVIARLFGQNINLSFR